MHELGYVYILNNNETGHWKIGCTERPTAQRVAELNTVGSGLIGRWELAGRYVVELSEMRSVEQTAHRILTELGLRVRSDREVFRGTRHKCQDAILQSLRSFPKSMQIYSLNQLADDSIGEDHDTWSSFRRVEYRCSGNILKEFFFGVHRVELDVYGRIAGIDLSPHGFDTSDSYGAYLCDAYRGFAKAWSEPPVMWVDVCSRDEEGTFSSCGLLGDEWGGIQFYAYEPWDAGDPSLRARAEEAWHTYRQQAKELLSRKWSADEDAKIKKPVAPGNFERLSNIALSMVSPNYQGFDSPYRSRSKG